MLGTQEVPEAAAIVEDDRAVSNPATLHQRLRPCFDRQRPHTETGKYIAALMSDLPRKNGWNKRTAHAEGIRICPLCSPSVNYVHFAPRHAV